MKAEKTYRTAEWAQESKPPEAIRALMEKHGISVLAAGHDYPNMPPDLEEALKGADAAPVSKSQKKKGGK